MGSQAQRGNFHALALSEAWGLLLHCLTPCNSPPSPPLHLQLAKQLRRPAPCQLRLGGLQRAGALSRAACLGGGWGACHGADLNSMGRLAESPPEIVLRPRPRLHCSTHPARAGDCPGDAGCHVLRVAQLQSGWVRERAGGVGAGRRAAAHAPAHATICHQASYMCGWWPICLK